MNKKTVFGDLQVKKSELFVSLVFNDHIINQKIFSEDSKHINLIDFVDFVGIKNGMCNQRGYFYPSNNKSDQNINIKNIKSLIIDYIENEKS